jgi:hypothetical protein
MFWQTSKVFGRHNFDVSNSSETCQKPLHVALSTPCLHLFGNPQHTIPTPSYTYLLLTMATSATVHPAAGGHNLIPNRLIDTKFKERVVNAAFNDLVQYRRHPQFKRYRIPLTTTEGHLILAALK